MAFATSFIGKSYEGDLDIDGWNDLGGGLVVAPIFVRQYQREDGAFWFSPATSSSRKRGRPAITRWSTHCSCRRRQPASSSPSLAYRGRTRCCASSARRRGRRARNGGPMSGEPGRSTRDRDDHLDQAQGRPLHQRVLGAVGGHAWRRPLKRPRHLPRATTSSPEGGNHLFPERRRTSSEWSHLEKRRRPRSDSRLSASACQFYDVTIDGKRGTRRAAWIYEAPLSFDAPRREPRSASGTTVEAVDALAGLFPHRQFLLRSEPGEACFELGTKASWDFRRKAARRHSPCN